MPPDEITISVATPKGMFTGSFAKTAKVADVIATIIEEMELDGGESFDLVFGETTLEPQRTLVSYHIEDGAMLDLVATGSGV